MAVPSGGWGGPEWAAAHFLTINCMTRFVVSLVILAALASGCGPRYVGGMCGSYANADRKTFTEVATQRDQHGQLLFVIAWTRRNGDTTYEYSGRNLLTSINGHPVQASLDHRAVYALQADGTLQQLPLSETQTTALFQEMQQTDFHATFSALWQQAIAPRLVQIQQSSSN